MAYPARRKRKRTMDRSLKKPLKNPSPEPIEPVKEDSQNEAVGEGGDKDISVREEVLIGIRLR